MVNSVILFSLQRTIWGEKTIQHGSTGVHFKRNFALILGFVSWCVSNCGLPLQTPAANASAEPRITYPIDAARSQFTVRVFTGGLFKVFAHNHTVSVKDFDGNVAWGGATLETASLRLRVQSGSLTIVDPEVSEKDRAEIQSAMETKVLDVAKYPEITFSSTRVSASKISNGEYEVEIDGELQLHGLTRREVIPARVTIHDPELRARGEFSLKQTDYSIKPISVAGGTVKVKDEIRLSFDIVAIRQ